uniref:Subtilisin-like protease n=1 Tax=Oryza glumipatula TaxID=40148 RepID=A0A0D9ZGN2_9ORYZ
MADAACNEGSRCRIVIVVLLVLLLPLQTSCQQSTTKKLYVVYLGDKQHEDPEQTTASHHDMLTTILGRQEPLSKLYALISVTHGFSGFAAMLTESQAQEIAELPEVRSIKPSSVHRLHTTHSQDFLGLDYTKPTGLLHDAKYGDGVIIGIIDTGIWPESASFSDDGLGPVPSKWKGTCQTGQEFSSNQCNRKIIGARWYDKHLTPKDLEGEYRSARDANSHGTHVASTAAGALVPNVSFHGLAAGYARGVAPHARLAVYKACWGQGSCDEAAVMQAIDDAIHDGVDLLSLSLGGPSFEYSTSLHAIEHGITVIFSAMNDGPAPRTVTNASPWVISVASVTMDRAFPTVITLSDSTSNFVIVLCNSPRSVSLTSPTIQPVMNIVLAIDALKEAGAKGIIFAAYAFDMLDAVESCGSMPCVLVDFEVAQQIKQSADENTALVVKVAAAHTWIGGEVLAPKISAFSSRGPSPLYPEFLKPDIAAPGSNILAAVQDSYKFKSGTSMACPHVSGVIALLKALHPDWSPAIIKSALVTTASNEKYGVPILADGLPQKIADPFDYGGGFIDPNRAVDPGLAYDVDLKEYTSLFDCFSAANSSCESESRNLNLPSIAIPNLKEPTTVLRTVTNVGQADAVYKAAVQSPPGVKISVEPSVLQFSQSKKKQSFKVTFSMTHKFQGGYLFGSLAWCDGGAHYVRIPIAPCQVGCLPWQPASSSSQHSSSSFHCKHPTLWSPNPTIKHQKSKEEALESIIYSYKHAFSGFAAMLTESQAQKIAELPEVRSIKPSRVHPLHTTHSQDFLGLDYTKPTGLLHDAKYGDGIIIGIIDSGIWPESASFSDHGLSPIPSKWKGQCQAGEAFRSNQCNRKIIGARWYDKHLSVEDLKGEYRSARDAHGHGTHVASTAAGALVPNISFHGLAAGYARGVAPHARLAVYKACWGLGASCHDVGIIKAFDDAIHDGVDVLSLSIGKSGDEFFSSFHAVKNGITVIFAAGNEGPAPRTVTNASPWVITVASATIDRAFPTIITLANGSSSIVGQSLFYQPKDNNNWYEIHHSSCLIKDGEKINASLASGKIVFCYSPLSVSITSPFGYVSHAVKAAKEAGAKGIIIATYGLDILDYFEKCGAMPCIFVDFDAVGQINSSGDENTTPLVKIAPARTWVGGEVLAPKISTFSSRGPSPLLPQFLKPDVAAPGSNILAAVKDSYKFQSGTSMACPHVSGVAALLKALHPDWSPAIIKSALVTTASNDRYGLPILANGLPQKIADPFDYGGGFIDPNKATDPGLAYDVDPKDYDLVVNCESANSSCESIFQNLNLPSIAIPNLTMPTTVLRTVTNVGQDDAIYKAVVQCPPGVRISVEPSVLQFKQGKKKQSFKVTFSMTHKVQGSYLPVHYGDNDGGPAAREELYVAYLGEKQHEDPEKTTASHYDMLTSILGSKEEAIESIIYSYKHGFSGFAAMLTESQAQQLAELPEVHSIKPSSVHPLHTTRSQDFIGLDYNKPTGLLHDAKRGDGVIIGVIDTGIWPESASFSDDGLGPVPSKWKGICQAGQEFSSNLCNRKIIGARWYDKNQTPKDLERNYRSARDAIGHGTHVASTAAGALVPNVSFHGLAAGYARGTAPHARLAVYKACWSRGCKEADVMQAVDDAIHDGVDVLSISAGFPSLEYYSTLHAVNNGITVVFAAGNDGPAPRTVTNASPWSISVASATVDHKVDDFPPTTYISSTATVAREAGAKGIIFPTYALDAVDFIQDCGTIPCVLVDFDVATHMLYALNRSTEWVVKVSPALTWIGNEVLAPRISTFSSRGPSPLFPQFLKPDVAAPGSNILAAVQDSYKFMSGTSMACPHVSGVAALLKALYPDWSPAIIKSAIVTTASNDRFGFPILADGLPQKTADPFDYGGGFIDPNRAVDPGLAYDVDPKDYTPFHDCFLAGHSSCESQSRNLNLPSIVIPNLKVPTTVLRTVTNVGQADAVYKAVVQSPPGVQILVEPSVLKFSKGKNKQSFKVTFTTKHKVQGSYLFGNLAWHDGGAHYVKIPIAVRPVISNNYYSDV